MTEAVHDLLVVGAGIGGLTAAALAAKRGLDVLVAEGHTRPGGCAGDFVRRGVLFPAGATVVLGFEEGGLHRQVHEQLGLPIAARRLDRAMMVHLPDREVAVVTDRDAWDAERRRAFPSLGVAGERFWRYLRALAATAHGLAERRPVLPITSLGDARTNARLLRPDLVSLGLPRALPALCQTIGGLLRRHRLAGDMPHRTFLDNQLLISAQCTSEQAVALNGALALEIYRYGTFHLPEGTATIAHDLAGSVCTSGGEIRYGTSIRSLRQDGSSWIATAANGETIRAHAVVANVPATSLIGLLGERVPSRLTAANARRPQPWGAVVLYAAVEPDAVAGSLPRYHQVVDSYDGAVLDGGSCFVSVFDRDRAGARGAARVTVSTHTRVEPWLALRDRHEYLERKQRIAERLLLAAERTVPNLRQHVRFFEVATPLSFRRWIGRPDGRVGGVPRTPGLSNLFDLSHRVGLPGLFLCGDSVFPGQGTVGVTLSGINVSAAAVEYIGRHAGRVMVTAADPATPYGPRRLMAGAVNGALRS